MSAVADVIVVGGGVVGLSVALRLRQAGLSVTLVERGACGREASWAGAGILSPTNPHRTDPLHTMNDASLALYPAFCAEIQEHSGIDPQYLRCGAIELLVTEQRLQMAQSDVRAVAQANVQTGDPALELLSPAEIRDLEPRVTGDVLGGLHCRRTAQVRNPRLLSALKRTCERFGVEIREQATVIAVEWADDRVGGVWTANELLAGHKVVICAGAWSATIGPTTIGQLLPVSPVRGQIVLVQTSDAVVTRIIQKKQNYVVPRQDGLILIGSTHETDAGFEKRNTARGVAGLIDDALCMVPELANAAVVCSWAGLRPGTPDLRPYIGPIPQFNGLYAATGHYRSGLTLAPVTAQVMTDIITRGQSDYDLRRCAVGRQLDQAE